MILDLKQNDLFNQFTLKTFAFLCWDFLKLAKVKDFSLTVMAGEDFEATMPYSTGAEVTKTFSTEGVAGVEFGFYGFQLGAYVELATTDYYNTHLPVEDNASSGKSSTYTDGIYKGAVTITDNGYATVGGRAPAKGEVGPSIEFQYFCANQGFRVTWRGLGEFRDINTLQYFGGVDGRNFWENQVRIDYFIFF